MHGANERRRSSGTVDDDRHHASSSDDDEFSVEDDELITNESRSSSRPNWWKKLFSLKRSESSFSGTTGDQNTHHAVTSASRNGISSSSSSSIASDSLFHRMVIRPDNWWFVAWTHFILVWAVYSSFFTPLEFGFFRGLPENLFTLDSLGQLAFLIDIIVRFFVAYRDFQSHRIVYDRHLIAVRHLKSRFLVDLLGCLPWDAIYKASRKKEGVRYLLWIRLSRAQRVTEFFEKLEKDIRINYLFTRIAKLFVVELYSTHTAACIFYYLATTMPPAREGYTWIGSLKMGDYSYAHFRDIDLWKRYITSLYFAVVTMATVGYGEIHAVNVREMIFIMFYVSFDMILGAYLLGNITALIVKGSKTEKFRDKMADLLKYMSRNNIDRGTSKEIKNHLRLQYDRSYTEAAVLQDIPASIRSKISQKLYEPYIKEVHIFKGCSTGFIRLIATKIHEEFFLPSEVVIEQGNVVDHLYIVCHGELKMLCDDEPLERLKTYSSFGEVSFLCNTPQPYSVQVLQLCKVLRLDRQSFREILEIYFLDGRLIMDNLVEGKDLNTRNKLLESDIILYIGKHEMELLMKLNCAAYDGDFYRLKRLIGAGVDPNKVDYTGRSPLHVAASRGFEDITRFLIEKGVDVKISDKFGKTPLLEAIENGHDHVASLLVQAGASLASEDAGDFLCATVARRDIDLVKRLLANDMNPNAKNYDQRSPLHVAAAEGLYAMAKLLIEAGASVLSNDRWGKTPLDEARIGGNKKLMQLLESTRLSQLAEFSDGSQLAGESRRRKRNRREKSKSESENGVAVDDTDVCGDIALLLTLPAPKLVKSRFVSLIALILQPALFVVPFAAFQLLDIYWKMEHRLICKTDVCTAAERDRSEKSLYKAQRNVILCSAACLLYWCIYRICKYNKDIESLEEVEKRFKEE